MNPVSLLSSDTAVGTEADVMNPVSFVSSDTDVGKSACLATVDSKSANCLDLDMKYLR